MPIIKSKRVRNVTRHLRGVAPGSRVVVALSDPDRHTSRLRAAGLTVPPVVGERILPARVGRISTRNAEGHFIVHRDRPKVWDSRQIEWTWTEFHGKQRVEQRGIRDVRFQRYQRTFIPPPAVELTVAATADGEPVIVCGDPIEWRPDAPDTLKHHINLLLELVGEAHILDEALAPAYLPIPRRVNWELLPAGEHPWPAVRRAVGDRLDELGERTKPVAEFRLKTLSNLEPDWVATGRGGFAGYLAFGFDDRDTVILESLQYANATYVLDADWQRISALTKAQILNADLHRDRLIHARTWPAKVRAAARPPRDEHRDAA